MLTHNNDVAEKVESGIRLPNLGWSHHQQVASLPPEKVKSVRRLPDLDFSHHKPGVSNMTKYYQLSTILNFIFWTLTAISYLGIATYFVWSYFK